jgi:sulfatase modifying factor 1
LNSIRAAAVSVFLFSIGVLSNAADSLPRGMVYVKGGAFVMGDRLGDGDREERPVHRVTVRSFLIGRTEVTQGEWQELMGADDETPCYFQGADLPVEEVNWYECIEYCNKRSLAESLRPFYVFDKNRRDPRNTYDTDLVKWLVEIDPTSDGYRLPTEAEWEYAARGGAASRGTRFSGSDDPDEVAWYTDNSGLKTHPVAARKPNELGLYDMSGNVWEWCWDWFDRYPWNLDINPTYGRRARVVRGGSYGGFAADDIRCSSRWCDDPDSWEGFFGFRVCRSVVK